MGSRFEKFTGRARRVLMIAQEDAQRHNHNYVGTEHILLGLLREPEGLAARIIAGKADMEKIRAALRNV